MTEKSYDSLPLQADHTIADLTTLNHDERSVISDLFHEAADSTDTAERMQKLEDFGRFAVDVAVNDRVQRQAELDLRSARSYSIRMREETEALPVPTIDLDTSRIGWLNNDDNLKLDLETLGSGQDRFLLGDITGEHKITADAFTHLEDEGVADKLMQALKDSAIPNLLNQVRTNTGKLRPINHSSKRNKQRQLNTSYPAYKVDVQGTNNRAILLLPEKIDGVQVVVLAAIYDHVFQDSILNVLNV